jgi:hypothetical protein
VVILVIIVVSLLCYLIYRLSCNSNKSTSAQNRKESSLPPAEKYIKEFQDCDGFHRYEYKIDKTIYEPSSQPGVREVKEYNIYPPQMATQAAMQGVTQGANQSPPEKQSLAKPITVLPPPPIQAAPIVQASTPTPVQTPVAAQKIPPMLAAPVQTKQLPVAPVKYTRDSSTSNIYSTPPPIENFSNQSSRSYDSSRSSEPIQKMGMSYFGTTPTGDSLYSLKTSNSPQAYSYRSPLDLLKQDS